MPSGWRAVIATLMLSTTLNSLPELTPTANTLLVLAAATKMRAVYAGGCPPRHFGRAGAPHHVAGVRADARRRPHQAARVGIVLPHRCHPPSGSRRSSCRRDETESGTGAVPS